MRIILVCILISLFGCDWQQKVRPSVLVIAVNRLGNQDVACQDTSNEIERTGFDSFCGESVRFTHAYSTSPQGQSAIASLLTGLYPDAHGVWHNGGQFVSGKIDTVPEMALKNGYRTAFFSGGPPIFSKSGLRQGFEMFDDNVSIAQGKIYRPVMDNFDLFFHWLDDLDDDDSYFSIVFLPDLQFGDYPTSTDAGEGRKKSVLGQIQEVDESLENLFKGLKKRKRWKATHIVITGLSGRDDFEYREFVPPESVFSDNLQVALLIKAAENTYNRGGNWKVDKNVSLADVGATLFEFIGSSAPAVSEDKISPISLSEALKSPQVSWPDERAILAGSGWPSWMKWGENRMSVRSGYFLILLKNPLIMFNTLTDKLENTGQNLPLNYWPGFLADISKKTIALSLRPWTILPKELLTKFNLAKQLFSREPLSTEQMLRIVKLGEEERLDDQILSWAAVRALNSNDWEWLAKLGELGKRSDWKLVARRGAGQKIDFKGDDCLSLSMVEKSREDIVAGASKYCDEPMFAELLLWLKTKDVSKENNRDNFIRDFQIFLTGREISVNNYLSFLDWDVDRSMPAGPSYSEMLLALPENKKFLDFVNKRLASKN